MNSWVAGLLIFVVLISATAIYRYRPGRTDWRSRRELRRMRKENRRDFIDPPGNPYPLG